MLFAERKRRQRLAGKIGHDDSEYEIGRHHNIGILPQGKPPNTPRPPNRVLPDTPRQQPCCHGWRQETRQPQSSAPPAPLHIDLTPRQTNNNVFCNDRGCGLATNFNQVLPALPAQLGAAWAPLPPVVNKNPLCFKPVLGAGAPISQPLVTAVPSVVHPLLPSHPVYTCSAAAPNNLPPLQVGQPTTESPRAETPVPYVSNSVGLSCSRSGHHRPQSAAVGTLPNLGAPEDPAEAKRLARQRAIELQQENARLLEERRRQQLLERQLQIEDDRRREDAARAERLRLGQKELTEMEAEHAEAVLGARKGRGGGRSNWTSDEQLREDLMRQISEKKRRREADMKAAEREALKTSETNQNGLHTNLCGDNGTDHSRGGRGGSPAPLEHTAPCTGSLSSCAGVGIGPVDNGATSVEQPPGMFPQGVPQSYLSLASQPFAAPKPFVPFQFDPLIPHQRPCAVSGAPGAGLSADTGTNFGTSYLPPLPSIEISTPRDRASTHETERIESHLRDMISEHESITRMLESEVPTKPSEIPLYRPQPIGRTKVSFAYPSNDVARCNACGTPTIAATAVGLGVPATSPTAAGYGISRGNGIEELSAEPSTFIGVQPNGEEPQGR